MSWPKLCPQKPLWRKHGHSITLTHIKQSNIMAPFAKTRDKDTFGSHENSSVKVDQTENKKWWSRSKQVQRECPLQRGPYEDGEEDIDLKKRIIGWISLKKTNIALAILFPRVPCWSQLSVTRDSVSLSRKKNTHFSSLPNADVKLKENRHGYKRDTILGWTCCKSSFLKLLFDINIDHSFEKKKKEKKNPKKMAWRESSTTAT